MILRFLNDRVFSPRVLVSTGLFLISGGRVWARFPALHGGIDSNSIDFWQGLFIGIGIGIGLEVLGIRATSSRKKREGPAVGHN